VYIAEIILDKSIALDLVQETFAGAMELFISPFANVRRLSISVEKKRLAPFRTSLRSS
jgi:hypothetical protein